MIRFTRVPALLSALALLTVPFAVGGCAGGDSYSLDTGRIGQRYLPTTRTVAYPPDSMGRVSLEEVDGRLQIELESSYENLHREWSSTYQNMGTRRSRSVQSYATFWSLELMIASLEADYGFSSLTEARARKFLREREEAFEDAIQIDVYWFEREGNSLLTGPGRRVELEVGDESYSPIQESNGPLRETFLSQAGSVTLYRRNTFHFERVVDGTDLLEAESMELRISHSGIGSRVRFAWEWDRSTSAEGSVPGPSEPPSPTFGANPKVPSPSVGSGVRMQPRPPSERVQGPLPRP